MPAIEPTISVVIPLLNEEGTLRELYQRIREQFNALQVRGEIIFIDDGSTDGSGAILRELATGDPDCRVIFFRRNCGKAAALQTGFRLVRGQYVLTMDADLQDDPQEIPRFIDALQRVDVVSGWKAHRLDPVGKTLPSRLFNATVRHVTGIPLHDMNCGFKGYRRQVVQEITLYGELHRYIPALAAARGFRIEELIVTHHPRRSGVSKYGWERFTRGLFDLFTVVQITKYQHRPLHLYGNIALTTLLVAIILGLTLSTYRSLTPSQASNWFLLLWLVTGALFAAVPVFLAAGMVAESVTHRMAGTAAPPPVAERLNCTPAVDEVSHAG